MNKFTHTEKLLMLFCLLLFVGGSYLLSSGIFQTKRNHNEQEEIAVIDKAVNDGRVRGANEAAFIPVRQQEQLFDQDTIFSGDKSSVDIKMNTGAEVHLGSNSMVVLQKQKKKLALKIDQGYFNADIPKDKSLNFANKSGWHKLFGSKHSKVKVEENNGQVEIKVLSGDVKLETEHGVKELKENQKISIKETGSLTPVVAFEPKLEAKEELSAQEVSSPKATEEIADVIPPEEELSIAENLPQVTKVAKEESVLQESLEKRKVASHPEIMALSPTLFESEKEESSGKGSAYISWSSLNGVRGYEVFISQREDFKGAKSFLSTKSKYPFMVYFEKDYFWKVRAIDKNFEPVSEFSKTFSFKVIEKEKSKVLAEGSAEQRNLASQIDALKEDQVEQAARELVVIPEFWLKLGAGYNFVQYQQKVDDYSTLKYQSLKGPTSYFNGGAFFGEHTGVEATYKDTVGEIDDTDIGSTKYNYHWKTLSLEGLYRNSLNRNEEGFVKGSQWLWRLGIQQHFMPFLNIPDFSALGSDLKEVSLLMASGGFSYFLATNRRLRYEFMLRYQYPISSGSKSSTPFKADPIFAFDGSLGANYLVTDHFSLGFYWYGQWHSFKYTYGSGSGLLTGDQNIFFSNFDLRIGVEY